ncbi:MAG: terminase family protein [Prevotellaceae bacterium]|nr:terminase family protein [Candidatus Faecinaster equi]
MKLNFKINLTESQKEAYQAAHDKDLKYLTLVWSRQSGKSTLMKVLCIEWLFQKNKQIAYVCRNYILAKRIYKDILQYVPRNYIKSSNGTDLTITSTLGSTLTFFSAESGASLRGLTFHYLVCDEFAFFKQEQTDGTHLWNDILFPTVKVNGILTIFVSTPLGKNNIFYDMYLKGIDNKYEKYHSILKTIYSDGLVTDEEIEEIKAQIPELSFKQEFCCEFLDSSLTYFIGFEKCFKPLNFDYNQPLYLGFDLSANGKDETIGTIVNQQGEVKQISISGTLDNKYQLIADIINTTKNIQGVYIENNGIGAPMINEVLKLIKRKSLVHEWNTSNTSKNEILSNLAVKIANKTLIFNELDTELYSQFGTFITKYSKTGRLQLEAQTGHKDDRVMSLAIALKAREDFKYNTNISFAKANRAFKIQ